MSKMTAVQWLVEQINPYGVSVHQDLFEQALQMEREQIVVAFISGGLNWETKLIIWEMII